MSPAATPAAEPPRAREWAAAGAGYLAFFALLLLPVMLRGELPGNCDTWLNGVALPNLMLARLREWLGGPALGTSFYPESDVFSFGESAFGTSAFFVLWKALSGDDVVAYWLFMTTLLALDALGVFALARCFVRDSGAAAVAGLGFAASNYHLGNIDSPHSSFFFVAFLCLYFLKRWVAGGRRRDLLWAGLLGGAQAWFSAYVFLFQSAAGVALLVHAHVSGERRLGHDAKGLACSALLFLLLAGPFFAMYARAGAGENFSNPWTPTFLAEVHSLEPADLFRTLENNRLYPFFSRTVNAGDIGRRTQQMVASGLVTIEQLTREDARVVMGSLSSEDDVKYFVYTRRCAWLGVALYALAFAGLRERRRWDLPLLYLGSLLVAFGPWMSLGDHLLPGALYPAYAWLDVSATLRVPSRAFAFSLLAVVIAAAIGLERLGRRPALARPGRRAAAYAAIAALILLENVPMPLKSFEGARYARPSALVSAFFADRSDAVLLDLPSRPGGALYRDSQDLFEWNRELIYMNHQTEHRQNIVNGVHGYFPKSRLEIQRLIDALPDREAFRGLRKAGVEYVVYHKDLELPWEEGLYRVLLGSGQLALLDESEDTAILGWSYGPASTPRGARPAGARSE